jgi:hypothetical protein
VDDDNDTSVIPPTQRRGGTDRIGLRSLVSVGLALLGALGLGGYFLWSQSQFFVVEQAGAVVVQHGVGPFADFEPVELKIELLPADSRTALVGRIPAEGRAEVATEIAKLRDQVAACEKTLVAPCPVRALDATTLEVDAEQYPKRDHVRIAWRAVDNRGGVVVKLRIDGKRPPKSCPKVLTVAGSCVFDGDFEQSYRITAVTSGPDGTTPVVSESIATTDVAPHISIKKGKKFKGKALDSTWRGTFCEIVLTVEGMERDKAYKATVLMSGHKPYKPTFTTDSLGGYRDMIDSYADSNPGSWVQVKVAGLTTKRLPWQCGG